MTQLPILLPHGFTPLVSVDEVVAAKQPIAERNSLTNTVTINVPDELSIPVNKTSKTIKKNPGDTIEPGDVIAVRKGFLGMGEQKVMSSVSGRIVTYERRTGDLTIQLGESLDEAVDEKFRSPVAGKVTVCDNGKIVIETEKDALVSEKSIGGSVQAELLSIKHTEDSALPLHLLTTQIIGKVIVSPYLDKGGILKAIGMDTAGIIVSRLDDADAEYLAEKEIKVPVMQVAKDDYPKIVKWAGKQVFIDGTKQSIILLHT